jgi:3-hydroxyisobutyrate dehydrogenase-like beta-hydroxyacid dehydrogenase
MYYGDELTVGVLGLGRMGLPIARRLVSNGLPVVAGDVSPALAPRARSAGARWEPDAAALASAVDILITVLPGRREVEASLGGPHGVLSSLRLGSLWLDLTSGDPRLTRKLAGAAAERRVATVGAPMGGGPSEAGAGSLSFYVGGADADVERCLPLLDLLSKRDGIRRAGTDPGDGQSMKLLANLLWFGQVVAATEAMLLGQSLGLTVDAMRDILPRSAGASAFLSGELDLLLAGDYLPSFGLDRCVEELETLGALARAARTPFELSTAVTRLHEEALERFGAIDGELLVARLLEERAGRTLRG